jgi:hypothetical protein
MEASRAATGMLEVLATRHVLLMIDSTLPSTSTVSSGKSRSTLKITKTRKIAKPSRDTWSFDEFLSRFAFTLTIGIFTRF